MSVESFSDSRKKKFRFWMLLLGRHFLNKVSQKVALKSRPINQWPHINRPALTAAVASVFFPEKSGTVTWLTGGSGSGKTECVMRAMTKLVRKRSSCVLLFDFAGDEFLPADFVSDSSLALAMSRSISLQLSRQLTPDELWKVFQTTIPGFDDILSRFAIDQPLWSHLWKKSKSPADFWQLLSPLERILPTIRLSTDPMKELDMYVQCLSSMKKQVDIAMLHVESIPRIPVIVTEGVLSNFFSSRFNLLVECNDSLRSIWNICEGDFNLIEIDDFPIEAIEAIFVPNLLEESHVKTLYSICGGRVGELEKLMVPLNILIEEKKIQDQQQEQEYQTGRQNRPSSESKALQIDTLVHSRDILMRDSLDNVFKPVVDTFETSMNDIMINIGSTIEAKVLLIETMRLIGKKLRKNACIALPGGLSPNDIEHPIILALLKHNHLRIAWLPYPRLVVENPIKLLLMESWASAQTDVLPIHQRIQYNIVLLKNKLHLDKQLDKLRMK